LLALGLGEAGVDIVGKAIAQKDFNPTKLIPKTVDGIYGFCEVRDFMVATEVLKGKVMLFVNQIAEIVHAMVSEFHGAPNKNLGQAFLVVWKIQDTSEAQRKADLALLCALRVVAEINKSPVLADYREHPGIIARLSQYRVSIGFGLHMGWALECAIGSEFKIDATYLSPNVNMAVSIGAATRQFGVSIMFTSALYCEMSSKLTSAVRQIDRIQVPGTNYPIRVFTVDLRGDALPLDQMHATEFHKVHTARSFEKLRVRRELRKRRYEAAKFNVAAFFREDKDIGAMRKGFKPQFSCIFNKGVLNYEAGEWAVARQALERASEVLRVSVGHADGPSRALLQFMRENNYVAPADWKGYRQLSIGDI